jgi:predicted nucleic acid-binding protein
MLLLDTSGLLCLLDEGEPDHRRVRQCVDAERGPLITIDFVLAETAYLVLKRLGGDAERAFVSQLAEGVLRREPVTDRDLDRAGEILTAFSDQQFGLTDAALMAIAERLGALRVLTLDLRHFARFRDRKGRALELLPS